MTNAAAEVPEWAPGVLARASIFTRSVRRDLTDLNLQYLELGLRPEAGADPLFAWSEEVRREIEGAGPSVRERMAACPFTLFEIGLPQGESGNRVAGAENPLPGAGSCTDSTRVEDRAPGSGPGVARAAGCVAFTHGALFTAWRLADSAPRAARIAFGLSPAAELELNETCPTRIALLAMQPGIVRARWPAHPRFWALLRGAAQADSASSLQWAHCVGICLMEAHHVGKRTEERPFPQGQPHRS